MAAVMCGTAVGLQVGCIGRKMRLRDRLGKGISHAALEASSRTTHRWEHELGGTQSARSSPISSDVIRRWTNQGFSSFTSSLFRRQHHVPHPTTRQTSPITQSLHSPSPSKLPVDAVEDEAECLFWSLPPSPYNGLAGTGFVACLCTCDQAMISWLRSSTIQTASLN
jgi:hypothetical protein